MDLEHFLKELKTITPDAAYSRRSRMLLVDSKKGGAARTIFVRFALQTLQLGSAITLAGLLLLLVVGGFSLGQYLSPLRLQSLDLQSLRAEAEAIDFHIQLTDLDYRASGEPSLTTLVHHTSTPPTAEGRIETTLGAQTSTEAVSIDEALKTLSE